MDVIDTGMHWFELAVPAIFIIFGIIIAIKGITGKFPEAKRADYNLRTGKIVHIVLGIGMLLFGLYLLYCWIFGPIRYDN